MTVSLRTAPDGASIGRLVKAFAASGNSPHGAYAFAEGQRELWRSTPSVYSILEKGAVGANTATDASELAVAQGIYDQFVPLLRPRSLVDRIPGFRRVPQNVSVLRFTGDATGAIIAEGAAMPVSSFSLERVTIDVQKIAALIVETKEAMRFSGVLGETSIAMNLASAVGLASDRAMFDVNTSGSIANAGTIIVSAGSSLSNIDSDLARLFAYFGTNDAALDSAVFIMAPTTAAYLGALRGTGGALAFNGTIGARGGSLHGIPVFVSGALEYTGSPSNRQISLFDPGQVLLADPGAVDIATSESTVLQMDNASTQHSGTPTGTTAVSMWQTNSIAVGARRWINWLLANSSACITLNGVAY